MPNNNNDGAPYKTKKYLQYFVARKNRATKTVTDFTINANLSIVSVKSKQKSHIQVRIEVL